MIVMINKGEQLMKVVPVVLVGAKEIAEKKVSIFQCMSLLMVRDR